VFGFLCILLFALSAMPKARASVSPKR